MISTKKWSDVTHVLAPISIETRNLVDNCSHFLSWHCVSRFHVQNRVSGSGKYCASTELVLLKTATSNFLSIVLWSKQTPKWLLKLGIIYHVGSWGEIAGSYKLYQDLFFLKCWLPKRYSADDHCRWYNTYCAGMFPIPYICYHSMASSQSKQLVMWFESDRALILGK